MGPMKKMRLSLACALLAALTALSACGSPRNTPAGNGGNSAAVAPSVEAAAARTITVSLSAAQDTLDPASATAPGSETILHHLFENLMRWEDGGDGWAVLAPGQAESYEVDTDFSGSSTYTFTLREGLHWSDGKPVTANDFVTAWRRLANPSNNLPHRELLRDVAGYGAVQESMDASQLAVSAPDERTFVVALTGSPAYFLEEVCASAYTMPVREDLALDSSWGRNAAATVTNGPYTAVQFDRSLVALEFSPSYNSNHTGNRDVPAQIHFLTSGDGDYEKFLSGELDLVTDLPGEALQELAESGLWTPEPVSAAWGVLLNTQRPPFDDASVRLAFRLAIDSRAVVEAIGDPLLRSAAGLIPYGVSDYGQRVLAEEAPEEETALPDPNAAPAQEEPDPVCWDFRAHSLEKVTAPAEQDYGADCVRARSLLAQAGYAGGAGFPAVEYLYVDSSLGRALAGVLQSMWQEQLGVSVTPRAVSQEEYDASVALVPLPEEVLGEEPVPGQVGTLPETTGEFTMAAQVITPSFSDAGVLLERWYSQSGENVTGYTSGAFDILIDAARAAAAPEVRDAYLHDAEAILLEDAPVIPVCCQGGSFRLAEGLSGLYRAPNGVYFLYYLEG